MLYSGHGTKRVSDMATKNIKKTQSGSVAVHGSADDVHHVVGLGNIRVIIVPDGSSFFAQGLEIDFASQGSTVEETKKNFEHSLCATIEQHIKIYGHINGLLQPAPLPVWQELVADKIAMRNRFWLVSEHTIEPRGKLPYEGIKYLVEQEAAA
jgi:hypothetical protein